MYINGTYTRVTSAVQCLVAFDDGMVFMVHINTSSNEAEYRSIKQDVAMASKNQRENLQYSLGGGGEVITFIYDRAV